MSRVPPKEQARRAFCNASDTLQYVGVEPYGGDALYVCVDPITKKETKVKCGFGKEKPGDRYVVCIGKDGNFGCGRAEYHGL